jgi:ectoine hydroxylase-related dioxygenase (phytanoyl-CoA dioxygenase family)
MTRLTPEQWTHFHDHGYVILRSFLSGSELSVLQGEIDNIMLGGGAKYANLMMERDADDESEIVFSTGFKGATLDYKRIQHLETVPVFRRYIQKPIFHDACRTIYGSETAVSVFRTMLVNKLPHRGARIGWHQDCWNYLDGNPVLTVWTALDPVTSESGCLQIIPGSHKSGPICPEDTSGFLTDAMIREHCLDRDVVLLKMEPGDVAFLHNHLLHTSDVNRSEHRRRALSVCYMDASIQNLHTGVTYPVVFGSDASTPHRSPSGHRFRSGRRAVSLETGAVRILEAEEEGPFPVAKALTDGIDPGQWLAGNSAALVSALDRHGAMLLRGFACNEDSFGTTVERVSGDLFAYSFRSTPRSTVKGFVYTSTEYPQDQQIPLHNEMSYAIEWPRRLWMLCTRPATTGGATMVADSMVVRSKIPADIREPFERLGVEYRRRYGPHLDLPWQEGFQTNNRAEVDAECRRQGLNYEWVNDVELVTSVVRPACISHPRSGDVAWFNQAHLFHTSALPPDVRHAMHRTLGEDRIPRAAYFGDRSVIPDEFVAAIHSAYADAAIDVEWKSGDLLVVDNERIAHGRRPFTGPRRVVVAMSQPATGAS